MNLENNMVVGPDDFDEVVECSHLGEMILVAWKENVDEFDVRIRCVDCDTVFEGNVTLA
jgi:hypothetical protein